MPRRFVDITGQRFGRLIAVCISHRTHNTYWKCLCDCGEATTVQLTALRNGHTKSCGCLLRSSEGKNSNPRIKLTEYQFEVITGELLGDGSIDKDGKPVWTLKREGHVDLLAEIFHNFKPAKRLVANGKHWSLRLSANGCWKDLRKLWYPNGKKIIPTYVKLTPTVCYHWYIGDGNFTRNRGCCGVSACAFSKEDLTRMLDQLAEFRPTLNSGDFRKQWKYIRIGPGYTIDFQAHCMQSESWADCYGYKFALVSV